jgi:hypothetical protein
MSHRLPQALSRGALLLLAMALATGCYNPRKDKGLVELQYTQVAVQAGLLQAGPGDLDDADKSGMVRYEAPRFDVKAERRVGDVTIPQGARVQALFVQGRLVLPPDFEWIKVWRSDFAYAKRYGSKGIVRIDLDTRKEEAAPFTALAGQGEHMGQRVLEPGFQQRISPHACQRRGGGVAPEVNQLWRAEARLVREHVGAGLHGDPVLAQGLGQPHRLGAGLEGLERLRGMGHQGVIGSARSSYRRPCRGTSGGPVQAPASGGQGWIPPGAGVRHALKHFETRGAQTIRVSVGGRIAWGRAPRQTIQRPS